MALTAHLLYKFTFVEAFPQQLFLNDTSIGGVWISNLFLHVEHKHISQWNEHLSTQEQHGTE